MRVAGDQSRIGERLANTTEAVQEMRDRIKRNRLDDPMLEEMLRQSEDILMEAARSSAEIRAKRAASRKAAEAAERAARKGGAAAKPKKGGFFGR